MRSIVLFGITVSMFACVPVALQQGARPVGAGKTVVSASTSVYQEKGRGFFEDQSLRRVGEPSGMVRHGFGDRIDAGLQVYTGGARVDAKYLLYDAGSFAVAVSPGLLAGGYRSNDEYDDGTEETAVTSVTGADATVIFGLKTGENELFVAPRFLYLGGNSTNEATGEETIDSNFYAHVWGGQIGYRIRLGGIDVIPEIGLYKREIHAGGDGNIPHHIVAPTIGLSKGF